MQPACCRDTVVEPQIRNDGPLATGCRPVKRGQALYRTDDAFGNFYCVLSGSLKTVLSHVEGREQISSFPIAGDLLGMDGVGTDRHTCDAIALEDSQVCVVPFAALAQRGREQASVQKHIHRLMGAEIVREQKFFMLLGGMSSEERLATFLVTMLDKLSARGYSSSEFNLRMTREEIGSHLGMKLETVSRTFSKFQDKGWLAVQQKHITILNLPVLREISCR